MSLRDQARQQAEDIYREALKGLFRLIEDRIEWRRANAALLALEAGRMIHLLRTDPGRVAMRRARIAIWRRIERKHKARAWAADQAEACACGIAPDRGA
jgi:hypothetical protein